MSGAAVAAAATTAAAAVVATAAAAHRARHSTRSKVRRYYGGQPWTSIFLGHSGAVQLCRASRWPRARWATRCDARRPPRRRLYSLPSPRQERLRRPGTITVRVREAGASYAARDPFGVSPRRRVRRPSALESRWFGSYATRCKRRKKEGRREGGNYS